MKPLKPKLRILLLLTFCCATIVKTFSQQPLFSFEKFINNQDTLLYRQLIPDYDTLRKYPLVIFLHGSGERGKDNVAQLKWGVSNFAIEKNMILYPAIVIAPQCPEKMTWSNFSRENNGKDMHLLPTPSKPMELLMKLIQQVTKKFSVDPKRIYITGLSMGGFGTFDALERYPEVFAAAVPVCGGGDVSKAPVIAKIPMWVFHGAEDAAVSPLLSLKMVDALTKAGAHPGFTQYPEVGHFSWLGAYTDPLMMEWLFRQHK